MRKSLMSWAGASLAALPLASLFTVAALSGSTALADQKVGVAAAVKPEATSQPPGGDASTLRIGKSVVYNERIDTAGSGQVQVLLVDGSTFTVGPGSSLVIDKFVYNPGTGKGALVANFSKGALRFVGGKLSKNDPGVKINTPAGALTVRGGIVTIKLSGPNQALITFDYGISASFLRHGQLQITRIAGDVISVNGAGPAVIRSQTMADVNATQGAVAGKSWKKTASRTGKKKGWPYYYGIQPTGRYPDQPFVREWQYDGATTGILLNGLTRVPTPPPPNYPTYNNLSVGPNLPR
jgi:FecR-like protein